jgi:hypothetical protein
MSIGSGDDVRVRPAAGERHLSRGRHALAASDPCCRRRLDRGTGRRNAWLFRRNVGVARPNGACCRRASSEARCACDDAIARSRCQALGVQPEEHITRALSRRLTKGQPSSDEWAGSRDCRGKLHDALRRQRHSGWGVVRAWRGVDRRCDLDPHLRHDAGETVTMMACRGARGLVLIGRVGCCMDARTPASLCASPYQHSRHGFAAPARLEHLAAPPFDITLRGAFEL